MNESNRGFSGVNPCQPFHVSDRVMTSLRRQVLEAEVVETEKGSRIKSRRSQQGHGDQLSALALALFGVTALGLGSVPVCVGSGRPVDGDRPGFRGDPRFGGRTITGRPNSLLDPRAERKWITRRPGRSRWE